MKIFDSVLSRDKQNFLIAFVSRIIFFGVNTAFFFEYFTEMTKAEIVILSVIQLFYIMALVATYRFYASYYLQINNSYLYESLSKNLDLIIATVLVGLGFALLMKPEVESVLLNVVFLHVVCVFFNKRAGVYKSTRETFVTHNINKRWEDIKR